MNRKIGTSCKRSDFIWISLQRFMMVQYMLMTAGKRLNCRDSVIMLFVMLRINKMAGYNNEPFSLIY